MSALTWAELSHRKIDYVCTHGIDRWEYCRAIASHLRLQQEIEEWIVASFVGAVFILISLALSLLLADRRQRQVFAPRETPAIPERLVRRAQTRPTSALDPVLA
jgi:hypothetical protein